ncbi:MAG: acetylesterase [Butyrivibrio sp.]|nr:acetylesterase [Butyrivibrio sp.]
MAFLQVNYLSKALYREVPLNVILPADKLDFEMLTYSMKEGAKFKTLYLLHGLLGNYTDWVNFTRIQRWAEEKNLAVIMPSGDNAFYVDGARGGSDYGIFIGEELVEVTRKMFPLSDKREDTFIAGLSMGGFGAIRNGLKYSETFSHVAGLSSAIHIFDENIDHLEAEHHIFGNFAESAKTDMNPRVCAENLVKEGRSMPKFYMSCGTADDLYDSNVSFRDYLKGKGADVVWYEEEAGHEWDFWDREIKKVLDWLPLEEKSMGVSSGNVKK